MEARARQIPGLVRKAHNFDTQVSRPSHYTAVYCHPDVSCEAAITEEFGAENMVMPLAMVRLEGPLCVMGTHGPPPVPFNIAGLMPYMERIADHIMDGRMQRDWTVCREGDPVIVAAHERGAQLGDASLRRSRFVRPDGMARRLRDVAVWRGLDQPASDATRPSLGGGCRVGHETQSAAWFRPSSILFRIR